MYGIIVGIIIIAAIFLILVVLAQNPKGGGLSSQFGGSGASQVMGVKKTGDFLEKATWGAAITILSLTLATNFFIETGASNVPVSPNIESAPTPQAPLPIDTDGSSDATLDGLTSDDDSIN